MCYLYILSLVLRTGLVRCSNANTCTMYMYMYIVHVYTVQIQINANTKWIDTKLYKCTSVGLDAAEDLFHLV